MPRHRTESRKFVDDYLPALLAQASRLISAEFHRVVNANGFSVSEWRVLATLAGSEPISIGRLAQVTTIKQPTVTRLLDRMQAKGHVQRLEKDGDRRITPVAITPAGAKLVARLIPLAREHEQRVLEPFGLQRAEDLKSTLRSIVELHRIRDLNGAGMGGSERRIEHRAATVATLRDPVQRRRGIAQRKATKVEA